MNRRKINFGQKIDLRPLSQQGIEMIMRMYDDENVVQSITFRSVRSQGSVYQRVRPDKEIKASVRDKFWEQAEVCTNHTIDIIVHLLRIFALAVRTVDKSLYVQNFAAEMRARDPL